MNPYSIFILLGVFWNLWLSFCSEEKMHLLDDCCVINGVWFWSVEWSFLGLCWQSLRCFEAFIYKGLGVFRYPGNNVLHQFPHWKFISKTGFL